MGCYLPAGGAHLRRDCMAAMRCHMNPKAHTVALGGFNFTAGGGDRFHWNMGKASWADKGDPETACWRQTFQGDYHLSEIYQPRTTFHNTRWASRIDRVYSSLSHGRLAALSAQARIHDHISWSDHKPVGFSLSTDFSKYGPGPNLALWTFKSPRFRKEFEALYDAPGGYS